MPRGWRDGHRHPPETASDVQGVVTVIVLTEILYNYLHYSEAFNQCNTGDKYLIYSKESTSVGTLYTIMYAKFVIAF